MAYVAPTGTAVAFNFDTGGFAAPGGTSVAFDFLGDAADTTDVGSGGILVGGTAPDAFESVDVGAGGILVGGEAIESFTTPTIYTDVGSGGILVAGDAIVEPFYFDDVGSGGILGGGVALEAFESVDPGIGGILVGGAAIESFTSPENYIEVGSGGVLVAGDALITSITSEMPTGGILAGGTALEDFIQVADTTDIGSGGITVGGSAPDSLVVNGIEAVMTTMNASLSWDSTQYIHMTTPLMQSTINAQIGALIDADLFLLSASMNAAQGGSGYISTSFPAVMSATMVGGAQGLGGGLTLMSSAITGATGTSGVVDAHLTRLEAVSSAYTTTTGTINGRMPLMLASVGSSLGTSGTISGSLNRIRADIDAIVGMNATITATMFPLTSVLSAYTTTYGTVVAELPSMSTMLVGFSTPVQVRTLVMNTKTEAVWEYSSFPMNSFAEIGGNYYAASPSGLYQIDAGTKDDTTNVDATFKFGQLSFGSNQLKRLADVYASMRATGDVLFTVATDEGDPVEYVMKNWDVETIRQRRVPHAKGARGKYWEFMVSNIDGGDFEFDNINFTVTETTRKV